MSLFEEIKNLREEEIDSYIKQRVSVLRNKDSKEIGFNTSNTIYSGFLDDKVLINTIGWCNPIPGYQTISLGGLVVDDNEMFKCLIEVAKKENTPLETVMKATDEYLSLNDPKRRNECRLEEVRNRFYDIFSCGKEKNISIKSFHKHGIAECSEIAAVAHNMFQFLGIESDYAIGQVDSVGHAFNIVYPFGREDKAILFDNNHGVDSNAGIFILGSVQKERILSFRHINASAGDMMYSYEELFGREIEPRIGRHSYLIFKEAFYKVDGAMQVPSDNKRVLKYKIL